MRSLWAITFLLLASATVFAQVAPDIGLLKQIDLGLWPASSQSMLQKIYRVSDLARHDHNGIESEGWTTTDEQNAVEARLAIRGLLLKELRSYGISDIADMSTLNSQQLNSLKLKMAELVRAVLEDPNSRARYADEFARACDTRVAQIFGLEASVAAASGMEWGRSIRMNDGRPMFRFHLYSSAHVYSDLFGRNSSAPMYVPKGFTSWSKGSDVSNSSYALFYPQLGSYRNVTLNIVHLADASTLTQGAYKNRPEYNQFGAVRVGSSGGPGGEAADGARDELNYAHSHLQLFSSGGKRLTFFDVFCSAL